MFTFNDPLAMKTVKRTCVSSLVGVACLVFEIFSLFSFLKFPFWAIDIKNLIDQNSLKKFMQVGIDVKCMHTDFGGRGLSGFRDKISLRVHKSGKIQSIGIG